VSRRTRLILLAAAATTLVAITAAVLGVRAANHAPSGAVTLPEDVAAQWAAYLDKKHPERGKAVADPPICHKGRRHFGEYLVFVCFGAQGNSDGTTMVMQCVASTREGLKTSEDDREAWPKACRSNHIP
jgi:hypothetical protein